MMFNKSLSVDARCCWMYPALPDARNRLYTLRTVLLDRLCLRATADRLLVDLIEVSSSWSAGSPVE